MIDRARRPAFRILLFAFVALSWTASPGEANPDADETLTPEEVIKRFDAIKRASVDLERQPAAKAAEWIHSAFGVRVIFEDDASLTPVTLHLKDVTFFEALEALRKAGRLAYESVGELPEQIDDGMKDDKSKGVVLLNAGENELAPCAARGPLLLVITRIFTKKFQEIQFNSKHPHQHHEDSELYASGYVIVQRGVPFSGFNMSTVKIYQGQTKLMGQEEAQLGLHYRRGEEPGKLYDTSQVTQIYEWNTARRNVMMQPQTPVTMVVSARFVLPRKFDERRFEPLRNMLGVTQELPYGSLTVSKLGMGAGKATFEFKTTSNLRKFVESNTNWGHYFPLNGINYVGMGHNKYVPRLALFDAKGKELPRPDTTGGGGNPDEYTLEVETTALPHTFMIKMLTEPEYRVLELEFPSIPLP